MLRLNCETLLTYYAITIVYLSFNGIYLVCLSVRKWLIDMTTFTRIGGYGFHPPHSDYLVVKFKIQNSNKLKETRSVTMNNFRFFYFLFK